MLIPDASRLVGGKYRIRTCEGCYTLAVFETAAFSRSANFPSSKRVRKNTNFSHCMMSNGDFLLMCNVWRMVYAIIKRQISKKTS